MRPALNRIPAVVAALLLLTPGASAQTATADVPPGVSLRIDVMGPARVHYSGRSVTIDFNADPFPPPPVPPGPTPVDPPVPVDPPKPAWGPLDRLLILYETSASTGQEVIYTQAFQEALTASAPKDAGGWPRWRVWDKDIAAPDSTAASETAEWAAVLAKAKTNQGATTDPILYAADAKGEIRAFELKGMTPDAAVAKLRELAAMKGARK